MTGQDLSRDANDRETFLQVAGLLSRDNPTDRAHTAGMGALHGDRAHRLGGWFLVVLGLLLLVSVPISLSGGVMSRPGVVTSGPGPWIAAFVPAFVLSGESWSTCDQGTGSAGSWSSPGCSR